MHGLFDARADSRTQLMFNVGDEAIRHLFSRGTAYRFSYSSLTVFLVIYFFFACYSSGALAPSLSLLRLPWP
jgi:hypothetical protein